MFKLDVSRMMQFKCTNGKYVPASSMCDGIDHCGDHSDEDEFNGCTGIFKSNHNNNEQLIYLCLINNGNLVFLLKRTIHSAMVCSWNMFS